VVFVLSFHLRLINAVKTSVGSLMLAVFDILVKVLTRSSTVTYCLPFWSWFTPNSKISGVRFFSRG
jgi:hypothetical protein